jgi:hypothetical protein
MAAWKGKYLSVAGKEVSIKSVAQALPIYITSVFKLPLTLCDELMKQVLKQVRAFWWGAENGRRKVQWILWEKLVRPKGFGGMGFKDLGVMNQAMLARQAWRLVVSPDSFCAKVLTAKYYPDGKLLDRAPAGDASQTWRAIEHGLELLKQGVINRIGDGRFTQIWRDNWLPRGYGLKPIGPRRTYSPRWVHHLINDNGSWDETAIRRHIFPCDALEIFKISLLEHRTADFIAWHYEKSGVFSVRNAYRLTVRRRYGVRDIGSSSNSEQGRAGWKKLWQVAVPSKVSVFAMKIVNNRLPTRVNKKYRHLEQQDQLCGQQAEDVYHALMTCPHAMALRQAMRDHWALPSEQELAMSGLDWLLMLVYNNSLEVLANLYMLFWYTWNIQNKVIHEGAAPFIASSVVFLTPYMHSLLNIRQQGGYVDSKGKRSLAPAACINPKQSADQGTKRWKPPPLGTLTINVDAAFNHLSGEAAVGVVIIYWTGSLKLACYIPCRDAEEAEATACLEGVHLALRWTNNSMILEFDCQTVVTKLQAKDCDGSVLWQVIEETAA